MLVFGQQPELVVADALDIGHPPVVAPSAQHGLVHPGGQTFGQQPGLASPAQHGLIQSGGQTFGQQPVAVFSAEHTLAFSAKAAWATGHDVPPAAGQVLACEQASELPGRMFA